MLFTDPLALFFFVVGMIFGSFGNVLIARLPHGESIFGRSRCPHCTHTLATMDLFPVVSFLLLRGRCRYCRERISSQYPIVELSTGALFVVALMITLSHPLPGAILALALWLLFVMCIIDARFQGIPDALNFSFVALAAGYSFVTSSLLVWGPVIGAAFFFAQWILSKGRWVGSGDIILATGIGFLVGTPSRVILTILLAYIFGALVAGPLLAMGKKKRTDHLAFGPFLGIATLTTLLWGDRILFFLL